MAEETPGEILLVDGYNVINAWPELIKLKDENLEHARDTLADMLAGYCAYKGQATTLVFDAQEAVGLESIELRRNVEIVFTNEGETADSFIERRAYELRSMPERVYVVTSDWAEQSLVFGTGAYRISARELYEDFCRIRQEIRTDFTEKVTVSARHELEGRLQTDVLARLNLIRHDRCKLD